MHDDFVQVWHASELSNTVEAHLPIDDKHDGRHDPLSPDATSLQPSPAQRSIFGNDQLPTELSVRFQPQNMIFRGFRSGSDRGSAQLTGPDGWDSRSKPHLGSSGLVFRFLPSIGDDILPSGWSCV